MIRSFGIREFKGHRDTELELGRFTLLVGDNASGKTSVLDALALQGAIVEDPFVFLLPGASVFDLLRRGSGEVITMSAGGRTSAENQRGPVLPWTTKLDLRVASGGNRSPTSRAIQLAGRVGTSEISAAAQHTTEKIEAWAEGWERPAALVGSAALYRLRAEAIAAAAYSDLPEVPIERDGTNTAVALATMKLAEDDAFQRVEDGLRRLVPAVERIRIRRAKVVHPSSHTEIVGSKLYFDLRGAPDVPGDCASHGTLLVLALLTILHRAHRPNLILLDDFDHALHPRAQMELMRMLNGLLALDTFQDLQIVATTHSPYVLDELDPSAIYAFALRDDGTVASRRLSEHPDAERTRGSLKAGQLWSLDPERDWVLRA